MLDVRLLVLVVCCSPYPASSTVRSGISNMEDALMSSLLEGYDKNARPPPSNQTTDVHIGLFLSSIDDVEEHLLTFTVAGSIIATWTDERLTWNMAAQNGLDRLVLAANSIWKPDFALTDAVGDVFQSGFYSEYYGITISWNGSVSWTMQGSFAVRCDYNLTYYPFDIQTCDFRYESFNYPSYLLHLYTDTTNIDLSQYHENSEFAVVSTAAIAEDFVPGLDGNYSNVIFTMTIKRRSLYFMLNLILPCILLSVMTCFVFLLPAASGERVGLAITLLLAFSVFQLQVAGYLPVNSLTSTILTDFILTSMFFNVIAILVTIFVLRVSEKEEQSLPPWLEKFVLQKLGVFYGITRSVNISSLVEREKSTSNHVLLHVKSASSSADTSIDEIAADKGGLWRIVSSVKKVEEFLKAEDHVHKQQEKWGVISKVFDVTVFLLFSVAITCQCIGSLVVLPKIAS